MHHLLLFVQGDRSPNGFDVMIAAITALAPVIATMVTYFLTKQRANTATEKIVTAQSRIEAKAATAANAAADAAVFTVEGNALTADVHKVVNGRTDALIADKARLEDEIAALRSQLAGRRSGD